MPLLLILLALWVINSKEVLRELRDDQEADDAVQWTKNYLTESRINGSS